MKMRLLPTLALVLMALPIVHAAAQQNMNPTVAEIVDRMERNNQSRADHLKHYTAVRHYSVNYQGFPKDVSAAMEVQIDFDAPANKRFKVLSETGSKYICDHVLLKLVEGETDASKDKHSTALTHENYKFALAGTDTVNGRQAYILNVEPLTESKYLYRGKIWVDATDFAVMKIDAEPAKSPSFWISKTAIHHQYEKMGEFWLPQTNRSETKVRIGGTAVLTIDYGKYLHLNEANVQTAMK